MANINKKITLSSKGANAGPYFDIYYSIDCINYTLCIDGNDVYLPSVFSTAVVTVPDNTQCIKVVNENDECNLNYVIDISGTTTTTTAGTTTTTTTCAPCYDYEVYRAGGYNARIEYIDCFGQAQSIDWASSVIRRICAREITYLNNAAYTAKGNCTGINCDGTSSLNICDCDNTTVTIGGTNTRYIYWLDCQTGLSNNTLLSYFNPKSDTNCRVSGSLILPTAGGSDNPFTIVVNSECNCPTTTTTTSTTTTTTSTTSTTTTTAAPTTTTLNPQCYNYTYYGYAGCTVSWYDCNGNPQSQFINAGITTDLGCIRTYGQEGCGQFTQGAACGTTTTGAPATTTTTTTTAAPQIYTYVAECSGGTIVGYLLGEYTANQQFTATNSNCYVTTYTTTNPTIGSLLSVSSWGNCCPSPTTTTTAPPALTVTNGTVSCSGATGGWRSSFSGGSGTYSYVAYSDSQANAASMVNSGTGYPGARVTLTPGDTYYDWSGIANGTWWVALKDSLGAVTVQNVSVVVNCTAPTTTTTTTQARINVNFFLTLESGNDGTLAIYSASPAGSGYTLNDTLTFDGASYQLSLLPGDAFYATITQTARASAGQRGTIQTIRDSIIEDIVVTGAGSLPQSVSSTPITLTAGSAYNVYGLCGDQV